MRHKVSFQTRTIEKKKHRPGLIKIALMAVKFASLVIIWAEKQVHRQLLAFSRCPHRLVQKYF